MSRDAIGRYFEDFEIGELFRSPGRTVTEADVVQYSGLSGDYNQIHTDEEYAKERTIFGTRIAHGLLGLSLTEGLKSRVGIFEETSLASLEWTWRFRSPILIGDTLHVEWTIAAKRETSKPDRGIVTEAVKLLNQRGETVAEGEHLVMMKRRGGTA
jgi:acyl dehydratase